jgi:hypothetical protein
MTEKKTLAIDGRPYRVVLSQPIRRGPNAVRLVVPAYQPNVMAQHLLRVCIDSIRCMTPAEEYELWVVDNCSPWNNCRWLLDYPGINVALSRTKPLPPEKRYFYSPLAFWQRQEQWGSYANAVGLELALELIDPASLWLMTLHMDTMVCSPNWLAFLKSKLSDTNKAIGVCLERHRMPEGVVHILGCMVDYQVFLSLGIHFWPNLPVQDVGDKVTIALRDAGHTVSVCRNTYENPELVEFIELASPYKRLHVVRAFDDDDLVIFMHLGRGIPKADERYSGETASAEEWIKFAEEYVVKS